MVVAHRISRIFIYFYFNPVIRVYYYSCKAHPINISNRIKAGGAVLLNQ